MRFSVHFDCILNEKWLFPYRNNDISCTHARVMVWYGNILFDIVHNIIENILPKHKNM